MSLPGVCPYCQGKFPLEQALTDVEAREALMAALSGWPEPFPKVIVHYIALLSPLGKSMSFDRLTKVLRELVVLISTKELSRKVGKQQFIRKITPELWAEGMQVALTARSEGRLDLPLRSHKWLEETVWRLAQRQGGKSPYLEDITQNDIFQEAIPARPRNQTEKALLALEELKNQCRKSSSPTQAIFDQKTLFLERDEDIN
ncbi:conserved hypothetical protein [Gammaproteobacteria bacterium]